jgi:LysR family glycine cleavage system transcriptional activator
MKRLFPTMAGLLAFDCVARHESVTRAAEELCLSLSAVSKQLAALQAFVGRPLFEKDGRGVQLTASGREYWLKISPSLRMIESASAEAQRQGGNSELLVLGCVPAFLAKWLIPRLADFKRLYPAATFVFRHHVGLKEAFPPDVDATISHGLGDWGDVSCEYIAGRQFVCIFSPELAMKGRPIRTPGDLLAHPLLHLEDSPLAWRKWAVHHGLDAGQAQYGPHFVFYSAVIEAVRSGLGVGLVPRILVEDLLQQGRVVAFRNSPYEDRGHYLCFRNDRPERPVFAAFRRWLLEQGEVASPDEAAAIGAEAMLR